MAYISLLTDYSLFYITRESLRKTTGVIKLRTKLQSYRFYMKTKFETPLQSYRFYMK